MKSLCSKMFASAVMLAIVGCGGSQSAPSKSSPKTTTPAVAPSTLETPAASSEPVEVAEGWGGLTGRFVLSDAAPAPEKIDVTKDQEVCGKHDLVKEGIVVSDSGGLANVIVYVRSKDVGIHPDLEAVPTEPIVLDNQNCRFEPHIALVRAGQPLLLKNSDPVGHNSKIDLASNSPLNPILSAGTEQSVTLASAERAPVPVGCNIHPWMQGYLFVSANPYMAVTDSDGKFTIDKLPSGEWEFQIWHETVEGLGGVSLQGKETSSKGRVNLVIQPDDANDLGEVQVSLSQLK